MSCTKKRFFGIDLVEEEADSLSARWGDERTVSGALAFVGRKLLWRFVRSKDLRSFFRGENRRVVPVEAGVTRQVRLATGCRVGPFQEFQTLVRLLSHSEQSGAAVYLLGRSPEDLQRVEQNVRSTFPGLRVVGRAVFHPTSIAAVTTAIKKASPRIVLSGVTSASFFRWVVASSHRMGPVLTVISPRGVARMAGRGPAFDLSAILRIPIRLFLPAILIVHRLRATRMKKKAQG
jgi:hypothetical protein